MNSIIVLQRNETRDILLNVYAILDKHYYILSNAGSEACPCAKEEVNPVAADGVDQIYL